MAKTGPEDRDIPIEDLEAEALAHAVELERERAAGEGAPWGNPDAPPPGPGSVQGAPLAPPVDLRLWSLSAAAEELVKRCAGARAGGGFPWPGCASEWPDEESNAAPHGTGCLEPGDRANWTAVWKAVGPLAPDRLAVLVGPTGRGKTAFAVQAAEAAAAAGRPVLYASAELGAAELLARILAAGATPGPRVVTWRAILYGRVDPGEVERACSRATVKLPALYLWAPPSSERNGEGLRVMVEALAQEHGAPPLVVVDYVQRFAPGNGRDRRGDVSDLSGELRTLARPAGGYLGAGVLALSSTARTNYPKVTSAAALYAVARSSLEDLVGTGKETGELEYDANAVAVLTADPDAARDGRRRGLLVAAKVRELEPGRMAGLRFDGARGRWDDGPGVVEELEREAAARQAARAAPNGDERGPPSRTRKGGPSRPDGV